MDERAEFKLPTRGASVKLDRLPGQDPNSEYGIIFNACRRPGEGWGYVFEFTGKRCGHILAWLTSTGAAYACDGPLAYLPEGEPEILISHLPDDENAGQVEARAGVRGPLHMVSQYRRTPHAGTFSFVQPASDVGTYIGKNLPMRIFLAVSFLVFVYFPQKYGVATAGGVMDDVINDLIKPPLSDACESLLYRVGMAQPGAVSGFELYAARVLDEAGAARLRPIAARTNIETGRLPSTGLVWIRFDENALSQEERDIVLAVESGINRLVLVRDRAVAIDGAGALYAGFDEGFCSGEDWRSLRSIASDASELVQASEHDNSLCQVFGASAAQGGEWDVRTRFASACEKLQLPFRLEYRFDCNAATGVLAVEFSVPTPEMFPATRWDAASRSWVDMRPMRGWAASAYALRLAAVLAAAAFGASLGISNAYVTARVGSLAGDAGISLEFYRIAFISGVLPRITAGAFDAEDIAYDPGAVLSLLDPFLRSTSFLDNGFFGVVQPLATGLADRCPALWEDERALPPALADILRADRMCELDVLHDEDAEVTEQVNEVMQGAKSSPLACIATLEEILAQLEAGEQQSDATDDRVPLYCSGFVARAIVSLVDDGADTRYRKVSDAAFFARTGLSRLYLQIHDAPRALEAAETCITLAPTSLSGYFDAASVHMDEERFVQAEAVLRKALRVVTSRADCNYLLYRLAYALWMQGCHDQALACYVAVATADDAFAAHAEFEMAGLMEHMGLRERPSFDAAKNTMLAAGIPHAPGRDVTELIAQAAVGLTDAGILKAAAPLAYAVAALTSNDVLVAAALSLGKLSANVPV